MHVSALTVFPVKSGRGIPVDRAEVESRGLHGDRRWMVVGPTGRFLSQRELPELARLAAEPTGDGLRLAFGGAPIDIAFPGRMAPRHPVTIWNNALLLPEAPEASAWLTLQLGLPLRLVHQPDDARRPVDPDWGDAGDQVSLADGFPILIATAASLVALQGASSAAIGMERFRPNLVIDDAAEGEDDGWAAIRVGPVELDIVKPCARCIVTTVDQSAGAFAGEELLLALRRFRLSNDRRVPGVLFGWNAVPRKLGVISLGDPVEVLRTRPAWAFRSPGLPPEAKHRPGRRK